MGRLMMALVLALVLAGEAATAAEVPIVYSRAVERVEQLYLHRADADPLDLLHAAADGLTQRVDWLFADVDGGTVTLRHGAAGELGQVTATGWKDLPAALYGMVQLVEASGYETDDVELPVVTLNGMMTELDRYTRVLSGEGLARFDTRLKGTLVGIGATLRIAEGRLSIVAVLDDGPAQRGGLVSKDIITRIDEASTLHMPVREAVKRIRGEAGSIVRLEVERSETTDAGEVVSTRVFSLERDRVIVPNVTHRVLEGDVGYIYISNISQKTVYNLRKAMTKLREAGALQHGLVFDLRGNTGGSMKESAGAADQLLHEGLVLRTAGADGESVPNLLQKLEAHDAGDEPPIPVVVLVDPRTASGAEIISGALLELGRAALVGTRTYGKGEVQKIYDLDGSSRLKITVAEYLLANDRRVAGVGIHPDITLVRILLDEDGVRYLGWDLEREDRSWEELLGWVDEREGWREGEPPEERVDVALELARRAVLDAEGETREAVLAALQAQAQVLRVEQEGRLLEAFGARGIDWMPSAELGAIPESTVQLTISRDPTDEDVQIVTATVVNEGPTPLYRALLSLECPTFAPWDDLVVPIGHIPSGKSGSGQVRVRLNSGVQSRQDVVIPQLRADKRPVLRLPEQRLTSATPLRPTLGVAASLLGEGSDRSVQVRLYNLSGEDLKGLEVSFRYPKDAGVELLTEAARTPELAAHGEATVSLQLRLQPEALALAALSLRVEVVADDEGRLLSWGVQVPTDGTEASLQAPRVQGTGIPTAAAAGDVELAFVASDERKLDSVKVFSNGDKVAWDAGGRGSVSLRAPVQLEVGANDIKVVAVDDQGVTMVEWFHILGLDADGVAEDENDAR